MAVNLKHFHPYDQVNLHNYRNLYKAWGNVHVKHLGKVLASKWKLGRGVSKRVQSVQLHPGPGVSGDQFGLYFPAL